MLACGLRRPSTGLLHRWLSVGTSFRTPPHSPSQHPLPTAPDRSPQTEGGGRALARAAGPSTLVPAHSPWQPEPLHAVFPAAPLDLAALGRRSQDRIVNRSALLVNGTASCAHRVHCAPTPPGTTRY